MLSASAHRKGSFFRRSAGDIWHGFADQCRQQMSVLSAAELRTEEEKAEQSLGEEGSSGAPYCRAE